jgi:hypothetical protein
MDDPLHSPSPHLEARLRIFRQSEAIFYAARRKQPYRPLSSTSEASS